MSIMERLIDVRKSMAAKVIAVIVSISLIVSLTNISAFAEGNGYDGEFAPVEQAIAQVQIELENAVLQYDGKEFTKSGTIPAKPHEEFTVKVEAVEGYMLQTVEAVVKDEAGSTQSSELKANADGEYVIPADLVTDALTIKAKAVVDPQKIKSESVTSETNIQPQAKAQSKPVEQSTVNEESNEQNVAVQEEITSYNATVVKNGAVETKTIEFGKISEVAPKYNGYDFINATMDGTVITNVFKGVNNTILAETQDGGVSAVVVTDPSKIQFNYEIHIEKYNVTYTVKIKNGNSEEIVKDVSAVGELIGSQSVKQNENLNFAFTPKGAYTINSVTANGKSLGTGTNQTINGVNQDQNIVFVLSKKKTAKLGLKSSSNTSIYYDNKSYTEKNQTQDNSNGVYFDYSIGKELKFEFKANMNNGGNSKLLNKFVLEVNDGSNISTFATELPMGDVKTASTQNGNINVVVTKISDDNLPTYEITLTAIDGSELYQDFTCYTNCKDATTKEIWITKLDGVQAKRAIGSNSPNKLTNFENVNVADFDFKGMNPKDNAYIPIKLEEGYIEPISVIVLEDGKQTKGEVKNIDNVDFASYYKNDLKNHGFKWVYIYNGKAKDIRVQISATKAKQIAQVEYLSDNSTFGTTSNDEYFGNVINKAIPSSYPTKEGYVFQGWDLNGKTYMPGDLLQINDELLGNITPETIGNDSVFKVQLQAKWTEASKAQNVPFKVKVQYKSDENATPIQLGEFAEFATNTADNKVYISETAVAEKVKEEAQNNNLGDWPEGYEVEDISNLQTTVGLDGKTEILLTYVKKKFNYTVNYLEKDTNKILRFQKTGDKKPLGTEIKAVDEVINIPGYTFNSAAPDSLRINPKDNVINLYYVIDDTKTVDVTYQAQNGFVTNDSDTIQIVTATGLEAVTASAQPGYKFDAWYKGEVADTNKIDGLSETLTTEQIKANLNKAEDGTYAATTLIANYVLRTDLSYTVNYFEQLTDGTLTTNKVADSKTVINQTFENDVTEYAIAIDGYALIGEQTQQVTISADESQNVINFYYGVDNVSTDPANPGSSDGVPDMYQARVNFAAVNGSVNIPFTYVTLYDADGNYAVDGIGYLAANQIATATANAGYDQASLTWNVTPSTTTPITSEVTYTATFTATPVVPVVPTPTPAPTGPGAPTVAPGVPTPAAAAAAAPLAAPVATITDDATPLAAGETIDDEDTPLAAFDHVDCWVHWFILVGIILTAIYGAVVVRRRLTVVKDVDKLEDEVLDGAVAGATQSAPADNRQAI